MNNKLNQVIDDYKEQLLQDIIQLIEIPSIKGHPTEQEPFGQEIAVALRKCLALSERLGFATKSVDGYMGYAQYGEGTEYVGVFGHIDVVPADGTWLRPPFVATVENAKIYGRGVLDNKGPILCALYGLYAIKECEIKLSKPVRIIFGTDEESGFSDAHYYLQKEKPPMMGFTPDCKYPVVYGEKGRAKVEIAIDISSNAESATELFFNCVNNYFLAEGQDGSKLGISYTEDEFGSLQLKNYKLFIKQNELCFQFNLSYPPGCLPEESVKQISNRVGEAFKVRLLHNYNPVRFEQDSFLVKSLQSVYESVTEQTGKPVTTSGGTYAKVVPNIVPFGPSFPEKRGIAHNPDEYMDICDIIINAKIFAQAIYKLAK